MNKFNVYLNNSDIIPVKAKYLKDVDGFVYFYMEDDQSDMVEPIEVIKTETIQRIKKIKEEK